MSLCPALEGSTWKREWDECFLFVPSSHALHTSFLALPHVVSDGFTSHEDENPSQLCAVG